MKSCSALHRVLPGAALFGFLSFFAAVSAQYQYRSDFNAADISQVKEMNVGSDDAKSSSNYTRAGVFYDNNYSSDWKWNVSYGAFAEWCSDLIPYTHLILGSRADNFNPQPDNINAYADVLGSFDKNCITFLEMGWDAQNTDGVEFQYRSCWDGGIYVGLFYSLDGGATYREAVPFNEVEEKNEKETISFFQHVDGGCRYTLAIYRDKPVYGSNHSSQRIHLEHVDIYTGLTRQPVFSPAEGIYPQPLSVNVSSADAGAKIYYTLNGTQPGPGSNETTDGGSIVLNEEGTYVIKAAAFKEGKYLSAVSEGLFVATKNHNILKEDFSACAANEGQKQTAADVLSGWKAATAYQSRGKVSIGLASASSTSSLTTPALTLLDKQTGEGFTVEFSAKKNSFKNVSLKAAAGSGTAQQTYTLTDQWQNYSLFVPNTQIGNNNTTITFSVGRQLSAYIDNVRIWQMWKPVFRNLTPVVKLTPAVYENHAASTQTVTFKPVYLNEDVTVTVEGNRHNGFQFTGLPSKIEYADYERNRGADISFSVGYTGTGFAGPDTAIVRFHSNELDTAVYIFAESLLCPVPEMKLDVKQYAVDVLIDNGAEAGSYPFEFAFSTDNNVWQTENLAAGSKRMENLTPATPYYVKVRRQCSDLAYSRYNQQNFTTPAALVPAVKITSPDFNTGDFTLEYNVSGLTLGAAPSDTARNGLVSVSVNGGQPVYTDADSYPMLIDKSGTYVIEVRLTEYAEPHTPIDGAYDKQVLHIDLPDVNHVEFNVPETHKSIEKGTLSMTCRYPDNVEIYYKTVAQAQYETYTPGREITFTDTTVFYVFTAAPKHDTVFDTLTYYILRSYIKGGKPLQMGVLTTQTQLFGSVEFKYQNIRQDDKELSVVCVSKRGTESAVFTLPGISNGKYTAAYGMGGMHNVNLEVNYNGKLHGCDTAMIIMSCSYTRDTVYVFAQTAASVSITQPLAGAPDFNVPDVEIKTETGKAAVAQNADRIEYTLTGLKTPVRKDTLNATERTYHNLTSDTYTLTAVVLDKNNNVVSKPAGRTFTVQLPVVGTPYFANPGAYGNSVEVVLECSEPGAALYYRVNNETSWRAYSGPFTWNTTGYTTFRAMAVKQHMDTAYSLPAVYRVEKAGYPSIGKLVEEVYNTGNFSPVIEYSVEQPVLVTSKDFANKRFWVQDYNKENHGALLISGYHTDSLQIGDKLLLKGWLRTDTLGYRKTVLRSMVLSSRTLKTGNEISAVYVDTITRDELWKDPQHSQDHLVCIKDVQRIDACGGTYTPRAYRAYEHGNNNLFLYMDAMPVIEGQTIECDPVNITGTVRVRMLNTCIAGIDSFASAILAPRRIEDIDRIPQPGLKAGSSLKLASIFENTESAGFNVETKDIQGTVKAEIVYNSRNAFTPAVQSIEVNSGRNWTSSAFAPVTYTYQAAGGRDTAVIKISFGNLSDTLRIYAESRLCLPPAFTRAAKVTDSVIFASITFDSCAPQYTYRYHTSSNDWDNAVQGAARLDTEKINLSGLQAGTTYYYQIQSWCTATAHSDWSHTQQFTTRKPSVTISAPADNQTFSDSATFRFAVSNLHLAPVPEPAPDVYLPYGSAKIEILKDGKVIETVNNTYITAFKRFLRTGNYSVKVTLQSNNPGALPAEVSAVKNFKVSLPKLPRVKIAPAPGVYYDSVQITLTDTLNAQILYSFNGTDWKSYNPDAKPWLKTNRIYTKAVKEKWDTSVVSQNVYTIRPLYKVPDAAELYKDFSKVNPDKYYRIDGNLIITHVDSSNTYKRYIFVQDEGITRTNSKRSLIMHLPGQNKINLSNLMQGDIITGIKGTINVEDSLLKFYPVNEAIEPIDRYHEVFIDTLTIAQIQSNKVRYQGDLACIKYVKIETDAAVFEPENLYDLRGLTGMIELRTAFERADYINTPIETETEWFITGILSQEKSGVRLTPRYESDFAGAPYFNVNPKELRIEAIYAGSIEKPVYINWGNSSDDDAPEYQIWENGEESDENGEHFMCLPSGEGIIVSYIHREEQPARDTLLIAFSFRERTDTLRVYAESRLCSVPENVQTESVGPHYATLEYSGKALFYEIDTARSEAKWGGNLSQYNGVSVRTDRNDITFENLDFATQYRYVVRKVCAVWPDGERDTVRSEWVEGGFTTQLENTPSVQILTPQRNQLLTGEVNITYKVENVVLGTDPSKAEALVRISIMDAENLTDTVQRVFTSAQSYKTFLSKSGKYLLSVRLVNTDSTLVSAPEGSVLDRCEFTVDLPDVTRPVWAVTGMPLKAGSAYYDSVKVQLTCSQKNIDALLYSTNGTDYVNYTEPVWVKQNTTLYGMAVKDSMDAACDTLKIAVVSDVPVFENNGAEYNITATTYSWPDWQNAYRIGANNLRDSLLFEVRGAGRAAPAVRLARRGVARSAVSTHTPVTLTVYPAQPSAGPGLYNDTVIFTSRGEVLGRIVLHTRISAFTVPAVEITPEEGGYLQSVNIQMQCAAASNPAGVYKIHYTLNGSEPTREIGENCFVYTGSFEIKNTETASQTVTVKALAFDPAGIDTTRKEDIVSAMYTLYNPAVIIPMHTQWLYYSTAVQQDFKETLYYNALYLSGDVTAEIRKRATDPLTALTVTPELIDNEPESFSLQIEAAENITPGNWQDTLVLSSAGKELSRTVINLTVTAFRVPAVEITPASGQMERSVEVSMQCAAAGNPAGVYQIHYTLNGSQPGRELSATCFKYTEPFTLTNTERSRQTYTVKALAFDMENNFDTTVVSSMAVAEYVLTNRAVINGPDNLSFRFDIDQEFTRQLAYQAQYLSHDVEITTVKRASDAVLAVSATPGLIPALSESFTLELNRSENLIRGNYQDTVLFVMNGKVIHKLTVNIAVAGNPFDPMLPDTVATPEIDPDGGEFEESVLVHLYCSTPLATILFSTDGSEPALLYNAERGVLITSSCTLQTKAIKPDWIESKKARAAFVIKPKPGPGPEDPDTPVDPDPGTDPDRDSAVLQVTGSVVINGTLGKNATAKVTVKGAHLKENVNISCPKGNFSVTPAVLSAQEVMSGKGAEFTVTYNGALKTDKAQITLQSGGIKAVVAVTAFAVEDNSSAVENVSGLSCKVYPNPCRGMFKVEVEEPVLIQVMNLHGQCIYTARVPAGTHTVKPGPAGIYFVRLTALADSRRTALRRLIE